MGPGGLRFLTEEAIAARLRVQAVPPVEAALDGPALTAQTRLRPAAVLVPLLWMNASWHLLFTRRTESLTSHKGQVAFPGGGAEPDDLSPEDTALREADEEIGLRAVDVKVLGRLVSRPTVSNFIVTPVVAAIRWPLALELSVQEVSRVFTIPLEWLADAAHREEKPRLLPNGFHETVIYYQPYDGETLWGATARITLDLLRVLD